MQERPLPGVDTTNMMMKTTPIRFMKWKWSCTPTLLVTCPIPLGPILHTDARLYVSVSSHRRPLTAMKIFRQS